MSAAETPRSIDDLVLSPEGEAARLRAIEAIVDGIPPADGRGRARRLRLAGGVLRADDRE